MNIGIPTEVFTKVLRSSWNPFFPKGTKKFSQTAVWVLSFPITLVSIRVTWARPEWDPDSLQTIKHQTPALTSPWQLQDWYKHCVPSESFTWKYSPIQYAYNMHQVNWMSALTLSLGSYCYKWCQLTRLLLKQCSGVSRNKVNPGVWKSSGERERGALKKMPQQSGSQMMNFPAGTLSSGAHKRNRHKVREGWGGERRGCGTQRTES